MRFSRVHEPVVAVLAAGVGATVPEVIACSIALGLSSILCSAGGVGGGGVYVSVLMMCGGMTPHDAVPMSKAIVFTGSIASLIINMISQKDGKEKVFDVNACRMIIPPAVCGTYFGVLLNSMAKNMAILIALAVMLTLMSFTSLRQAWRMYQEEVEDNRRKAAGKEPVQRNQNQGSQAQIERDPASINPTMKDTVLCFSLLLLVIVCGALRPRLVACLGHETLDGFCSWFSPGFINVWDKLLVIIPCVACGLVMLGYSFSVNKHPEWGVGKVVAFQTMALITGVLAGLVGIGGGLVFAPWCLFFMDPLVAVGTSATCVLFTSTSTTMQYALAGRIGFWLALIYGVICCFGSAIGSHLVLKIRERWPERKSFISAIVVFTVVLSVSLVLVKLAVTISRQVTTPATPVS